MKNLNELLNEGYDLLYVQLKIEQNKISDEINVEEHKIAIQKFKKSNPEILKDKFAKLN